VTVLEQNAARPSATNRSCHDANVAKVSVIGVGMRSHAGVAQTMFKALAEKGINIQVISTSEIKIRC
jgi:aspartate kinase